MPKYSYTVINQEGQKLTGMIEADSKDSAHDNLSKLGFPILDIAAMEKPEESLTTDESTSQKFEFQAVDQNGKKVVGTIAAEDLYAAFKRLIGEYHFAVEQLYPQSLSAEAKEEQKKRGVVELYTALKNEEEKSGKNTRNEEEQAEKSREDKGQKIVKQVDFVLQKIESLLKEFSEVIRPEDKNTIQKKADRLIRLKTSKNTDYVKHLAEDLLLYVQNEEIFLMQEKNDSRIETFRIDAKKLMNEIHRESQSVTLRQDILNSTSQWLAEHVKNNSEPSWWEKLIGQVMHGISALLTEPPEVAEAKEKIRLLSTQIWDYYKMYIKESTMEGRKEIKESIRKLKEQKTEEILALNEIQQKLAHEAELPKEETAASKLILELTSMSGWLLAIYIALHVFYFYATSRSLPFEMDMDTLKITQSENYLTMVFVLLILHAGLRLQGTMHAKKIIGNFIIIPGAVLSVLIIIFNF